ncbi:MAG: single-stranded DNA-binding protein [Planctomycetes bacterium]|nr:single-stranded DNA-binding protein [Planctomycetota bacterium]
MAGAVNKVILIGNLGRDPELRKTPGGASVTDFSIATTEKFTDKQGQRQESTEWHNIVVWNQQAETAAQYLRKGSSVYIEGKLKTRSWDDNGQKRYKTEIVASYFQFLDSRPAEPQQQQGFQQPQQNQGFGAPQQQYQEPQQQNAFPQQPAQNQFGNEPAF